MLLRCETHRIFGGVGPRRAGEIADDAFIGNGLMQVARIFGPARPQE